MSIASRMMFSATRAPSRAQEAWTAFWQDPAQSRCVAGAPEIWQVLSTHWSAFAETLAPGARVLDLGCGAGAVARELLAARRDLHITGIDFARVPLTITPQVELLSDTAMEFMPFAEAGFAAAVSQFGIEYSRTRETARELERVLAAGARISFLVHHAESRIVATNRERLNALIAFLAPMMCISFCNGDAPAFHAQMASLTRSHPDDGLVRELARSLPSRLGRTARERAAIWTAVEDALAPERCLADCLNSNCVAADEIEAWSAPLRAVCELEPIAELREADGAPVAWQVAGTRRAS